MLLAYLDYLMTRLLQLIGRLVWMADIATAATSTIHNISSASDFDFLLSILLIFFLAIVLDAAKPYLKSELTPYATLPSSCRPRRSYVHMPMHMRITAG